MPKVFGVEHIIYVVVFLVILIASIILVIKYIKNDEKKTYLFMRVTGAILLVLIVLNRIAICLHKGSWLYLIIDSYCGLCSFVFSLALLFGKKDNVVLHFACYLGLVGGLSNVIYPSYISQGSSIFYFATITGLLHHSVLVYGIVMCYITKFFTPTFKKWYILPLGLTCCVSLGELEISLFGLPDAFLIKGPIISGTILTWYFIGALLISASILEMLIFDKINKVEIFKKQVK